MIATRGTVGPAEGIIDGTHVLFLFFWFFDCFSLPNPIGFGINKAIDPRGRPKVTAGGD